MLELKVVGNNYKELKQKLFELANDIATDSGDELEIQPAAVRPSTPATIVPSFTPPSMTTPVTQPEAPKRSRRSKAEVEADKLAKLQSSQAEVAAAQASHVPATPISIPQVPTTNHVVSMPTREPHADQVPAVVQQPVTPPPVQVPAGAYTLETFKTNIVMILNGLLSTGKLNSAWISDTSQQVFGGADIWLWSQNETKISELFGMFIQWGFVQEFKV